MIPSLHVGVHLAGASLRRMVGTTRQNTPFRVQFFIRHVSHWDDFRARGRRQGEKAAKEQKEIRTNTQKILQRLYKAQPAANAAVQHGAGYAVFSNTGVKILFAGSGKGEGVAVDNKTKKETFMKMVELQARLGSA